MPPALAVRRLWPGCDGQSDRDGVKLYTGVLQHEHSRGQVYRMMLSQNLEDLWNTGHANHLTDCLGKTLTHMHTSKSSPKGALKAAKVHLQVEKVNSRQTPSLGKEIDKQWLTRSISLTFLLSGLESTNNWYKHKLYTLELTNVILLFRNDWAQMICLFW